MKTVDFVDCKLYTKNVLQHVVKVCLFGKKRLKLHFAMLKMKTNEKRGGLKVVSFDRSRSKLFTLRFSNKSMQTPSCERRKTTQRTLFLSFEYKNCVKIQIEIILLYR
jgi:hypothetical protein